MKNIAIILTLISILIACNSNEKYGPVASSAENHAVIVEEVLQTTQYTYLKVKEGDFSTWLAVLKMQANVGEKYYYKDGLTMTNFKSKELNRVFDSVLFLDYVSTTPINNQSKDSINMAQPVSTGSTILLDKKEINIEHNAKDLTIALLFENKSKYVGKSIQLKGQVTKFSPGIMDKNWIHLQDGTEFSGNFDLTVTTLENVNVGDIITLKGTIALDKDFGYGYFYDVIMEDASVMK